MQTDHPLAQRDVVAWSDLEGQPLVAVSRTSGNRIMVDAVLVRAGVSLSWSYEVTHLSTSLGFVEAGLGISVLPKLATPQGDHPIIVTRPIGNPEILPTIGVVRRRGGRLAPQQNVF